MDIAALEKIQDRILDTLEKRFLSHEGIIFDYVGLDGKVILPTPEECKKKSTQRLRLEHTYRKRCLF